MRSEEMESKPPGFVKVQKLIVSGEPKGGHRFEILLPERVAERINEDEKIRQVKIAQALLDKKPQVIA